MPTRGMLWSPIYRCAISGQDYLLLKLENYYTFADWDCFHLDWRIAHVILEQFFNPTRFLHVKRWFEFVSLSKAFIPASYHWVEHLHFDRRGSITERWLVASHR
jgi:hypothetical protein